MVVTCAMHVMVVVVVLLMCATVSAAADDKQHFEFFARQYDKQYATPSARQAALIAFTENIQHINAHNAISHKSWTAGINQFTDLTPAQFKQQYMMRNTLNPTSFAQLLQQHPHRQYTTQHLSVPDTYDWRNYSAHRVVTPVVDQGAIGSCYAFSAIETISAQWSLATKQDSIPLSVEQIIDCSGEFDNVLKHADCGVHGGWPYLVYQYVMQHGITTDAQYDYCSGHSECVPCEPLNYSPELCGKGLSPPACDALENQRCSNIDVYAKVSDWVSVKSLDEVAMIEFIATVGPVSVAMASDELQYYKSGVFDSTTCDPAEIDHAIVVVGYTEDAYIVKNSWSETWGEQGYFRVKRGSNMCGIASVVTSAVV